MPLLNSAAVSANVDQLKTDLESLPEEAAGHSVYFGLGMKNAKEDALLEVRKLDNSDVRAGLTRLAEQSSKRMIQSKTKQANP